MDQASKTKLHRNYYYNVHTEETEVVLSHRVPCCDCVHGKMARITEPLIGDEQCPKCEHMVLWLSEDSINSRNRNGKYSNERSRKGAMSRKLRIAKALVTGMFILVLSMIGLDANAMLTIAVVDSGYSGQTKKLCKQGHYDGFTSKSEVGLDELNHGSMVLDTIEKTIADGGEEYCFVIIKIFKDNMTNLEGGKALYRAYAHLAALKPDIVNMSYGSVGDSTDSFLGVEYLVMKYLKKTIFVVSAGNNGHNFDEICEIYPACIGNKLKNVIVVGGSIDKEGKIPHKGSNRGKLVRIWRPFCNEEITFCGTSYSAPVVTGELAKAYFKRVKSK